MSCLLLTAPTTARPFSDGGPHLQPVMRSRKRHDMRAPVYRRYKVWKDVQGLRGAEIHKAELSVS